MDCEQRTTDNNSEQATSDLCRNCGQFRIDRSESVHSLLCRTCREKMLRYPVPKVLIFFSLVIAILVGIGLYSFPKVLEGYRIYENALVQADNGEIADALNSLNTLVEKYPTSMPIAVRMIDLSMEKGYYEYAGYVFDTYLAGKEADEDIVNRVNKYTERLDRYFITYNAITEIQTKLDAEFAPEEQAKEYSSYINELLNDPTQDKALLYYYLSMFTDDINEMKRCLQNCLQEDKSFFAAKVELATISRRLGDPESAEKYYREVLQSDKKNSGALRGLAVIRLLEGQNEVGLDLAYQAYMIDPEGFYMWETYIIALHENKKNSETDAQIKEYIAKGNVLSEEFHNYFDGKLSLHDYYIGE